MSCRAARSARHWVEAGIGQRLALDGRQSPVSVNRHCTHGRRRRSVAAGISAATIVRIAPSNASRLRSRAAAGPAAPGAGVTFTGGAGEQSPGLVAEWAARRHGGTAPLSARHNLFAAALLAMISVILGGPGEVNRALVAVVKRMPSALLPQSVFSRERAQASQLTQPLRAVPGLRQLEDDPRTSPVPV